MLPGHTSRDLQVSKEVPSSISPRSRFLSAADRVPEDGVSWDLGYGIASFTRGGYEKLCAYLGIPHPEPEISARMLQIVYPCDELAKQVCGDLRVLAPGPPLEPYSEEELSERSYRDEWGLVRKLSANGYYYDFVGSPLSECRTIEECKANLLIPRHPVERAQGLHAQAARYRQGGYAVGAWCFAGLFEMVFWLRGYKNAYLDFARSPSLVEWLMDALLEVNLDFWTALIDELQGLLDVALLTEDLGTQQALMISPKQFRTIVKPRIKALIDLIKQKSPNTRVLLHSDGAVFPIIGDFIDMGVDILNPIQPGASGMDPRRLKSEFGDHLSFHGAIDTQEMLPHCSPQEVRMYVQERIEILGAGGGYIVAPSHCVQPDIPPENVIAFVAAIKEMTNYP